MIDLSGITVRKQGKTLIDDISFSVRPGEHTAIVGPNGAGKSSLIKVLTKEFHPLQQPAMQLELFGSRRWDVMNLRKRLGIVTPDLQRICHTPYSVQEVVLSGFFSSIGLFHQQHRIEPEMHEQASRMLDLLECIHLADEPMHHLSSGEARRVLIARALIHDPEMLVLDEPSDNLDIKAQKTLRSTLSSLTELGKTIVIITHDLADILPEINRVIFMRGGRITADGDKSELLTETRLSQIFGTRVYVDQRAGFYKAWG